jgi:hypothetical protein
LKNVGSGDSTDDALINDECQWAPPRHLLDEEATGQKQNYCRRSPNAEYDDCFELALPSRCSLFFFVIPFVPFLFKATVRASLSQLPMAASILYI